MANTATIAESSKPPVITAGEMLERGRRLDLAIEALRTKVRQREASGWLAYKHETARGPERPAA